MVNVFAKFNKILKIEFMDSFVSVTILIVLVVRTMQFVGEFPKEYASADNAFALVIQMAECGRLDLQKFVIVPLTKNLVEPLMGWYALAMAIVFVGDVVVLLNIQLPRIVFLVVTL